jgi:Co/Zn/Cd efflux system component
MLIDVTAVTIGLAGAAAAQWPADNSFPGGYARAETLAALANGVRT